MKTKCILLVLPLAFASLVACGNNNQNSTIKLFDANSRLIGTPKPDPANPTQTLPMVDVNILTESLPTYRHKDKGDVPYVSIKELAKAVGTTLPILIKPGMTVENKEDGYRLYSPDKKGEFIFDAEKDIIKLKNGQSFVAPVLVENNGIAGDYVNYRGKSIKESDKTKAYKDDGSAASEYDVFDFGKYNFDIVKQGDECYVPFEAFNKVLFRDISIDLAYNGSDFFTSMSNSSFLASLTYSSEGTFQSLSGIYSPSKTKGVGEAYRFEYSTKRAKEDSQTELEDYTKFLILLENGTGTCVLCKGKTYDPSQAVEDVEANYSYSWKKVGDLLKINVSDNQGVLGTFQVHLNKTRVFSATISPETSAYNYDVLRFIFDTIYGLKDIKGYKDATSFFKLAGVDAGLKSNKIAEYNEAFAKLIGYVDDGHTVYKDMSHFSNFEELEKTLTYMGFSQGERYKKLLADGNKYMKAKMDKEKELNPDGQNPDDPNYYQGIKFSDNKETMVLSFNAFYNNDPEIKNMKEMFPDDYTIEEQNYNIYTRGNLIASVPKGFNQAFKILDIINKDQKVVKNVVIDLTTNGGGEIAIMPYLASFFSDDPTFIYKDVYNGATKEFHYKVDLNGDGVFGGEGDTYKGKFNFYFLTSSFSFSCGNCFPGMAKDAGAKIIGETSGGGTSPVGVCFDALGTLFNISNHLNMCYKVNGKYTQNDSGIALDHAFPLENGNWYDPNAVNDFIKTL